MAEPDDKVKDPTAATASGRRLAFLDVVRGVAALAVCMQHLCEQSFPIFRFRVGEWLNLGAFGVTAFFLVSGFIIPASLEKYGTLRQFWRGRVFRLYPMYLVTLAAVLLLAWAGFFPSPLAACHPLAVCVGANATMLEEYVKIPSAVGVAWTLGLEMVFYALCSVVFWLGWLKHTVWLTAMAIAVVAAAATAGLLLHRPLPMGRIGLLATCFFGTLVYRVYRRQVRSRALWLLVPLVLALMEGFWLRFRLYPEIDAQGFQSFTFACVCVSWGLAYVLVLGLFVLRERRFPAWLAWLGKVSYSFYLLADFVPMLLPKGRSSWVWIAESVAVCVGLSAVTYRWIERPAMLWGSAPAGVRVSRE